MAQEIGEEHRYEEVKARAKADPVVQGLKEKSDSAISPSQAREAAISYNRALFQRMRELDKTLSERADLVENAILQRINQ